MEKWKYENFEKYIKNIFKVKKLKSNMLHLFEATLASSSISEFNTFHTGTIFLVEKLKS